MSVLKRPFSEVCQSVVVTARQTATGSKIQKIEWVFVEEQDELEPLLPSNFQTDQARPTKRARLAEHPIHDPIHEHMFLEDLSSIPETTAEMAIPAIKEEVFSFPEEFFTL